MKNIKNQMNVSQSSKTSQSPVQKSAWGKENKMNQPRTKIAALALGLALAAPLFAGAGCGLTPATDIDRVQPNYVDKNIFNGEWYSRFMVVDKQYANSWLFEGFEGGLDRIRWEMGETHLTAFRSYEFSPGTESDDPGQNTEIAKFPIIKHFDIQRQYNPTTGVENNVIEENTTDKPYWERQYVRVDWSRNMVNEFKGGTISGLMSNATFSAVSRNANADPADPFKVRISEDYIETTIDGIAYPDAAACNQVIDFNCQGANIRGKFSFMKIDQTEDYEPLEYPDRKPVMYGTRENEAGARELCFEGDEDCETKELWYRSSFNFEPCNPAVHNPDSCRLYTQDVFTKFGFFRTDRYAYDRENGTTLSTREQLINRWDLWKDSYTADGDLIPYDEREPKTIVYHYNVGYPEGLKEVAQLQADDWNVAFLDTIANLQGKRMDQVEAEYGVGDKPFRAYEVRENSCNGLAVNNYINKWRNYIDFDMKLMENGLDAKELGAGNLEAACAVLEHYSSENPQVENFTWEQVGDLRHSFINWVATPEPAGPLGYGPSAADPITGEIISANANMYGASVDTYANWGADIVQVLNGELQVNDIINGTHIREHVANIRAKGNEDINTEDALALLRKMDSRTSFLDEESFLPSKPLASVNSNLDRVRDSNFEEEFLLTEEAVRLFAGDAADQAGLHSEEAMNAAMPSTWGRTKIPSQYNQASLAEQLATRDSVMESTEDYQARRELYNQHTFCYFHDEMEPGVIELAIQLQDEGMTREELVQFIRANIMRGVLAHEVGHTIGLRHNFEGSSDAMNYFPGYWDVTTGDHRDSDNPRKSELDYSSIMDYHQRFNSDFGGVGLYDKAAIKFGYGQLVEVFDESEGTFASQNFPANAFWLFTPNDLPYLLAGPDAHTAIRTRYDEINDGLFFEGNNQEILNVQDLNIEPNYDNLYKRKNITFQEWSRQDARSILGQANPDGTALAVEVPYAYCSDGFAWGGNLTCNRYDKGATSQDIIRNSSEMYEFYDPFYTYLGAKKNISARAWQARLQGRIYQSMRNAFTYYFYYRRSTALIYPTFLDWAVASHDGLNFLAGVVQRPDVGEYCLVGDMYEPADEMGGCANSVEVPLGPGRVFDSSYTEDELFRMQHIGHVWDKVLALGMMTSNDAFFYRDFSNQVDRSAFSISFYRVFQDEMIPFFTDIILNRPTGFAPKASVNAGMVDVVEPVPLVDFRNSAVQPTATVGIKPASNYYMSRIALLWAMTGFTSNLDQTLDFGKRAKISIVGSPNDPVFDGVPEAVFTDPYSLIDYHSYAVDGDENSLGYAMLMDLNEFMATPEFVAGDAVAVQTFNEKLELMEAARYLGDVLEDAN